MVGQPERMLVVVTLDSEGSYEAKRYAVMPDGERVAEPSRVRGGVLVFGNLSREDHKAFIETSIRRHERGPRPVDVEFVEVEKLPSRIPEAKRAEIERRGKIAGLFLLVLVGAIWPSLYSRRVPTRETWKRLLRRGIAGWAFSNFVKELGRRPW